MICHVPPGERVHELGNEAETPLVQFQTNPVAVWFGAAKVNGPPCKLASAVPLR